MEYSFLKDLAPTVALSIVLGYFHYRAVQTVTEASNKTIAILGQSHESKTIAFLDETKKKDEMIYNLVTGHLNKSNEIMEGLKAAVVANTTSSDKLSAVITQSLIAK
jgi:hypothetical protein